MSEHVIDGDVVGTDLAVIDEPSALQERPRPQGQAGRLTTSEISLLLKLHNDGLSQVAIAKRLNTTQPTISRYLQEFADTTLEAKLVLRRGAKQLAERVVEKANVDQALEALDRIDVAPKRREQADSRVNVMVGINLGEFREQIEALQIEGTKVDGN